MRIGNLIGVLLGGAAIGVAFGDSITRLARRRQRGPSVSLRNDDATYRRRSRGSDPP